MPIKPEKKMRNQSGYAELFEPLTLSISALSPEIRDCYSRERLRKLKILFDEWHLNMEKQQDCLKMCLILARKCYPGFEVKTENRGADKVKSLFWRQKFFEDVERLVKKGLTISAACLFLAKNDYKDWNMTPKRKTKFSTKKRAKTLEREYRRIKAERREIIDRMNSSPSFRRSITRIVNVNR